ncbi:MAG: hypothetical protein M3Q81_02215 [bacterium]|nr:hypothetical protein [bacterium]
MQISRHWRLNAQRYRLAGFRDKETGSLKLIDQPYGQRFTPGRREGEPKQLEHQERSSPEEIAIAQSFLGESAAD